METSRLFPLDTTLNRLYAAGDPQAEARRSEKEHVDTVTRFFDAVISSDLDAACAMLTDDVDVVLFSPPEFPLVRRASGPEEVRGLVTHNFSALANQQPEIQTITAQGDTLLMVGRESGTIRASGQPYDLHFVYQFNFRDGLICGVRQYTSLTSWGPAG
jgi:ketosteroid isomerase-like protein